MTAIIYVDRTKHADDGCDWTNVILWHMNAGARARSRSVFIPAPRPIQVVKPRGAAVTKNKKLSLRQRKKWPYHQNPHRHSYPRSW
jgi:hypothetical protein